MSPEPSRFRRTARAHSLQKGTEAFEISFEIPFLKSRSDGDATMLQAGLTSAGTAGRARRRLRQAPDAAEQYARSANGSDDRSRRRTAGRKPRATRRRDRPP